MLVMAHALGRGKSFEQGGVWFIPLICETPDGTVQEMEIAFRDPDHIAAVQKYFRSEKGMEPIEFEV